MLIRGVIYCPASSRFTVSAHSLTHARMLRFTETPSSSHNKVSVMCIRAHEDTSGTPGKKLLLLKKKKCYHFYKCRLFLGSRFQSTVSR